MTTPREDLLNLFLCMESSYTKVVGGQLVPTEEDAHARADWLYDEAEFGMLAHDGSADPDPWAESEPAATTPPWNRFSPC